MPDLPGTRLQRRAKSCAAGEVGSPACISTWPSAIRPFHILGDLVAVGDPAFKAAFSSGLICRSAKGVSILPSSLAFGRGHDGLLAEIGEIVDGKSLAIRQLGLRLLHQRQRLGQFFPVPGEGIGLQGQHRGQGVRPRQNLADPRQRQAHAFQGQNLVQPGKLRRPVSPPLRAGGSGTFTQRCQQPVAFIDAQRLDGDTKAARGFSGRKRTVHIAHAINRHIHKVSPKGRVNRAGVKKRDPDYRSSGLMAGAWPRPTMWASGQAWLKVLHDEGRG